MPARLPELSPSSVSSLSCAKRFHELYVLKRWPPRTAISAVSRGSAFHQTLHSLYSGRYGDGELDTPAIPALAAEAVRRQEWPEGTSRADEVARVENLVRIYLASEDPSEVLGTVSTEETIGFMFHHCDQPLAFIKATLDRVLVREDPGLLIVKEVKSGSRRGAVELREALILLWVARVKYPGFRYQLEYEFVDPEEGSVEREIVTTADVKGQLRLVVAALLRVQDGPPVAEPCQKCSWCHLRPGCQDLPPVRLGDTDSPFD